MAEEDKTKLRKYSETIHGDKETTTEKQPEYTERYEQAIDGFRNPDGTPNEAALQEFERRKAMIPTPAGMNPETGKVEDQNKFLTDVLHLDPDLMRKKREAEMELNRRKQKEYAWYNSLAVLGDMFTTAAGGNVWKRQPDQRAKAAHDTNLALEREQQVEDIANGERVRNAEKEYAQAVQKIRDAVGKAFETKKVVTQKSGGNSHSVTKTGKDVTSGWSEAQKHNDTDTDKKGALVGVIGSDGNLHTQEISKSQQETIGKHAASVYERAIKDGDSELKNHFENLGIVEETISGVYKWDYAKLVESGYLFATSTKNPNISNSIKDYYRKAVGDARDIVPISTVQDNGYQPQDNKKEETQTAGGL